MSKENLITELRVTSERAIDLAKTLPNAQWNSSCEHEGRTAGQVLAHIADVYGVIHQIAHGILAGEAHQKLSADWIDARNAERAEVTSSRNRREIVMELRQRTSQLGEFVEGLAGEDLNVTGEVFEGMSAWSIEQTLNLILISHVKSHMDEVERALINVKIRH